MIKEAFGQCLIREHCTVVVHNEIENQIILSSLYIVMKNSWIQYNVA